MNEYDGTFVTVEGLDSSGGTTLCDNLRDELGNDWEFTQEPSHGKYGQLMRKELQDSEEPTLSDFFLFLADRFDHCQSLLGPKLDSGKNIVCDRYNLSTYAYQSQVVSEDVQTNRPLKFISDAVDAWVIEPDITIFIDVPVDECLSRMDDDREKYEKENTLYRANRIYQKYADMVDSIYRVDGMQSEEQILSESINLIDNEV